MNTFRGFSKDTIDFFVELTYNNNKDWFHANKHRFIEYVKTPMIALSNDVYNNIKYAKKDFKDIPKIARVNRDIRFSKEKSPYKNSSWFYLREDQQPGIKHDKPTFFFEATQNNYLYGFGYSPSDTKKMLRFRTLVDENPKVLDNYIKLLEKKPKFYLEGECYKRAFKGDRSEEVNNWYKRKELVFICRCEFDDAFWSGELSKKISNDFISLLPIYEFFERI